MIIVAGTLEVDPAERQTYVDGCRPVIEAARRAPGCLAFHIGADPIEPGRINVFEQWDRVEDVEAFRGSGPDPGQLAAIRDAAVFQHEVASTVRL